MIQNNLITIIVLAYNEENTVLRALNSIKYQITNFGKEYDIQLIVADDCSSDKTAKVASDWVEQNKNLFAIHDIHIAPQNMGTCKNFGIALRKAMGDYIVSVSADDCFSQENIFKKIERLDYCDLLLNGVLIFTVNNLKVIRKKKKYLPVVFQGCVDERWIKKVSGISSPVLNGAMYKKSILTEDVISYMENYDLVDDRPRIYKIFKEKDVRVEYDNVPALLVGVTGQSVSTKGGQYTDRHNTDLCTFYENQISEAPLSIHSFYLRYKKMISKYRGKSIIYYFDYFYLLMGIKLLLNIKRLHFLVNELVDVYAERAEQYLKTL